MLLRSRIITSTLSYSSRTIPHGAATVNQQLSRTMSSVSEFYNLKAEMPKGKTYDFKDLQGKVVLIVNTASACGFTPQYTGLEELYKKYKDQGLEVIGFPCNQFGSQEPLDDEGVASFCVKNHGVSFPLMAKSDVNGSNANDVFKYLKSEAHGFLTNAVKWNFTKFIVDRNGKVVHRYSPTTKPESIAADVEKLLAGGSSVPNSPEVGSDGGQKL